MYFSACANSAPTDLFSPISLDALNSKAEMLRRRDNKYVIEREVIEEAMLDFATGFDILEIGGKRSFTYDTAYFDSDDRGCYRDHHRGRRRRAKVRIRNYVGANLCFVEVKLKDKRGETIKRRLKHDPAKCDQLDWRAREFVQSCYHGLYGGNFPYRLERVLDMRYDRVTLVAKEGGERMTIDNGLVFATCDGMEIVDKDLFVVETKSANGNGIADKVLRKMHRHPQKHCSKYCVGTAILTPEIKTNNFKMVLRKLVPHIPTPEIATH